LFRIDIPLATAGILAGIHPAAVTTAGQQLLLLIGADGSGGFIVTDLALNNTSLILMGDPSCTA
jgi:ABC-type proline/glycine betaine transport system permease subunit